MKLVMPDREDVDDRAADDLVDLVLDRQDRHGRRPACRRSACAATSPIQMLPVTLADQRRHERPGQQHALDGDVDHA